MAHVLAFLAGLFCANGIPHFTNGVSGRDFHDPALRRLFPNVPSPLFNVAWGLLNFAVASRCLAVSDVPGASARPGPAAVLGFVFASIGLSIYFRRRAERVSGRATES